MAPQLVSTTLKLRMMRPPSYTLQQRALGASLHKISGRWVESRKGTDTSPPDRTWGTLGVEIWPKETSRSLTAAILQERRGGNGATDQSASPTASSNTMISIRNDATTSVIDRGARTSSRAEHDFQRRRVSSARFVQGTGKKVRRPGKRRPGKVGFCFSAGQNRKTARY